MSRRSAKASASNDGTDIDRRGARCSSPARCSRGRLPPRVPGATPAPDGGAPVPDGGAPAGVAAGHVRAAAARAAAAARRPGPDVARAGGAADLARRRRRARVALGQDSGRPADVRALAVQPLRLRRAGCDARLDAELRPVREQRDAGAARDVRGPARAHAVHRQQLAVRLHPDGAELGRHGGDRPRRGGLLRRPAQRRHRVDGLHDGHGAHAPVLPAPQAAARARAARGAVPRPVRLGRRRLLPEQRRVPGDRGAGLSPQPADPRQPVHPAVLRDARHRRRRRAARPARQRGARRAGGPEAEHRRMARHLRPGLRPARQPAARDRGVGHLAPLRGRRVPARARRAEGRVSATASPRTRSSRSSARVRGATGATRWR